MNRFSSISGNSLENQINSNRRRIYINQNININLENDSISCNYNKMKILILIIITIIMSLSNSFYNLNNNINLVENEPRTILSLFENQILKMNSPLNEQKREKLRNLIQEEKNEENKTEKNFIKNNDDMIIKNINNNITDIINNFTNINIKDNKEKNTLIINNNIKKNLLNDFNKYNFKCKWKSINKNNKTKIYNIGDYSYGEGIFNIKKEIETFTGQEYMVITMKNNENHYIDNWIIHSSVANLNKIDININNNIFEIKGKFTTRLYKGEFFNLKNDEMPEYYETYINMYFPLEEQTYINNYTIYVNNFNIYDTIILNPNNFSLTILENKNEFNFDIKANIYRNEIERKILYKKIYVYFLLSILSSLFYILGIFCVINNIKKYEALFSTISINCFSINPIWNTYLLLANLNLFFKFNINMNSSLLITFLCGIKFLYFDFYLLTLYWNKRRNLVGQGNFLKEKLKFYLVYYLFLFFSFLYINSFFLNYIFIMVLCILLWIPQIIHNAKTNNKYGFPFIYILSSTVDKLIYPLYFRGFKNNFLGTKENFILMLAMIIFVCITIIIMYIQVFKGPRFMLSVNITPQKYNFYKDNNELLNIRNNIGSEECVICLLPIFEYEKEIMIEMKDKSEKNEKIDIDDDKKEENNFSSNDTYDTSNLINNPQNEGEKSDDNENENLNKSDDVNDILFVSDDNNILKNDYDKNILKQDKENLLEIKRDKIIIILYNKCKNICKNILFILRILFFHNFISFYKKSENSKGKAYMYTPCNHVFHTQCLEQWLKYKKECPNCRTSMEEYL